LRGACSLDMWDVVGSVQRADGEVVLELEHPSALLRAFRRAVVNKRPACIWRRSPPGSIYIEVALVSGTKSIQHDLTQYSSAVAKANGKSAHKIQSLCGMHRSTMVRSAIGANSNSALYDPTCCSLGFF
jgi:hypothetical protein